MFVSICIASLLHYMQASWTRICFVYHNSHTWACRAPNRCSESTFWANEWWSTLTNVAVKYRNYVLQKLSSKFRYSNIYLACETYTCALLTDSRMQSIESAGERFILKWISGPLSQPKLPYLHYYFAILAGLERRVRDTAAVTQGSPKSKAAGADRADASQ